MDDGKKVQYLTNPNDKNNMNVVFTGLWCKQAIRDFIDNNMDNTNYNFFRDAYNNGIINNWIHNEWLTNDEWIFQNVPYDIRRKISMSNSNVRIVAKFCRMVYFLEYLNNNNIITIQERMYIFDTVYNISEHKIKRVSI